MKHQSVLIAVFFGGTVAGSLDILFAISFAAYNGIDPLRLLQIVASGALGTTAFSGGIGTAVLGLACHFGMSYLWAILFLCAAWWVPQLARNPLRAGIAFGIVVFLTMRLVVLPLSAYPYPITFKPLATMLDLLSHTLLFGIPITMTIGRIVLAGMSQGRPEQFATPSEINPFRD